ncbi:2-dehydro-3-deoxygalactonokinase [Larkinella soli]|uniref:2-dehydro-3-deoxygalactonokinase n=1 Tax=Larkinella soli TaxID=1770527 RepID=UPI000FFB5DF7|nr:2-dehydro-3-deoxygalactonokinase [Larkinella soli]
MKDTLLCCDWGTSSFRLRRVETATRKVLHEVRSGQGIAATFQTWKAGSEDRRTVFGRVLAHEIRRLGEETGQSAEGVPVVLSGMASASIGLVELPYAGLPFAVDGSGAEIRRLEPTAELPHEVLVISGVSGGQDVMRGEETQLIGLYALQPEGIDPAADALLILPGTHSKHIRISDGRMTGFQTFMTGEVFALLVQHSILGDSVSRPESPDWVWFRRGVREGASASLLNALFSVRVNQLMKRADKGPNYEYLSGLLIGSELQGLAHHPQPLVLCSGSTVFPYYREAAEELGFPAHCVPAEVMEQAAVAGQVAVFEKWTPAVSFES